MFNMLRVAMRFGLTPDFQKLVYQFTAFNMPPEKISFPEEEEAILLYWQYIDAFKQQLRKTRHLPPYTFYDGPPFATGTPHYGHIAAGTIKDVVCRYASQTGHYVERRFGWDCHGLPVQYEIDKQLKITHRKQTLEMGIQNYNNACRGIVMRYSGQWEKVVNRFGRWIDFKNDYKTMDTSFMESVWYVFKCLFDKGLVYRSRRIMPYSNACNTVLSNFQVQQNYKLIDDPSIYITFPIKSQPQVKFLAWTTTPWTLPSNLALAVHPDLTYAKVKDLKRNEILIIGQTRVKEFFGKEQYEIIQTVKGKQLEGLEYEPLYDFFASRAKDGCFKVVTASFVTDSDGTGIVHCAPGFGEDDFQLCVEKQLIAPDNPPVPLDENGRFTKEVPTFEGVYIKKADELIMKDLKQRGRLLKKGTIKHNYPFCWRSETPLIYKAVSAWFIKVTSIKDDIVKNNHKAHWVPKTIQEKKFDNWLKDAKDWCFSRNRFWGNPIPLWVSEDGEQVVCVGSLRELQQLTGTKITDLHRQHIDHLTIESRQGKGKLRRIDEVFDCWFQSGSMPFAQVHYPFSTSEQQFNKIFPADFIGEGIDQTRGWFYTLNVIATGLKNMNPYKNLIVNGLVLTEDGKKMSKRLKNYPDPMEVCNEFGADAIRLYLINSPLVRADNLNFSKEGVKGVVKDIFLPWYNAYRFLIHNISAYEQQSQSSVAFSYNSIDKYEDKLNFTDRWILSALQILIRNVRKQMQRYRLYNVVPELIKFLQLLTNWYVRLNRGRMKGHQGLTQQYVSLQVLLDVLHKTNVLMSPYVPFLTEHMYQNIKLTFKSKAQPSIHHLSIPQVSLNLLDESITQKMNNAISIIQTARKLRQTKQLSLKNPISKLTIINHSESFIDYISPLLTYIQQEINVKDVTIETNVEQYIKLEALPNLPVLGPKFKGNKAFGQIRSGILKLKTQEIEKIRTQGSITVANHRIQLSQIIIQQKFIDQNVKDHQIIGGQTIVILLDTRQNEQLKVQGFARQLISRIQKLKKKGGFSINDKILVRYKFEEQSPYLSKAVQTHKQIISNAIKKPLIPLQESHSHKILIQERGTIDGEPFFLQISSQSKTQL